MSECMSGGILKGGSAHSSTWEIGATQLTVSDPQLVSSHANVSRLRMERGDYHKQESISVLLHFPKHLIVVVC